jgi:hypothetical protein
MQLQLPSRIVAGDVFGYVFPNCSANHPHPGIVLQTFEKTEEISQIKERYKVSDEDADAGWFCLIVMLSHSQPAKGEYAELMIPSHKTNTRIDEKLDVFVCYQHFDLTLLPNRSARIGSIGGPYLGRVVPEHTSHFRRQLKGVQAYTGGRSANPPQGMYGT